MRKVLQDGGAANTGTGLLSRGYKTRLVIVLLVLTMLNFADRAILAVLAQPIKEDLRLTDSDLGMLQGLGFAILYSLLGVPLGWLAERVNRKALIAAAVAFWSLMTATCGLAGSFATMLLGRIGVGIGEAGFQPPTSSLISDHFPADRRATVTAIILLGTPLGFLVGQSVGGWVGSAWNWRVAFFALGIPGLLAALLVMLVLREPPRGLVDGHGSAEAPPSVKSAIATLWSMPTFRHLLIGFTVSGFAMNAVAQFVLPFYLRGFGLPLATAGALFGAVAFTSNGLGMLVGGIGFDRLARRDARWPLWGSAVTLVVATPLYFGAFASHAIAPSLACIWLANLSLATNMAPSYAAFQNLVGPHMRAFTYALVAMVVGLIGAGLGPTFVGIASDYFANRSFAAGGFVHACPGGRAPVDAAAALDVACRAASTQGLRTALICVLIFFFWAAVHYMVAARTLRRDLYATSKTR